MVIIGVYQLVSNRAILEHTCMENIKKIYTYAGKYYDQQQYKAITEAAMV